VLALGLGITVVTTVLLVEGSLRHEIERTLPGEAPTFYFIDIQPDQRQSFRALVTGWPGARGYEEVPMLRGRIIRLAGVPAEQVSASGGQQWVLQGDRGITWAAEPPPGTRIVAGRWWPPDYAGPLLVSMEREAAEGLGLKLGDTIAVNVLGREVSAEIANFREVDWSRLAINFVMVFSPGVLQRAPQTALATVRLASGQEDGLEKAVTQRFANISAIRVKEALETVSGILAGVVRAVQAVAGVTVAAGLLVLGGVAATLRRRRLYDAVVLKVLGATRADLLCAMLLEQGLIGLATALIAAPLGIAIAAAVVIRAMEMPFRFSPLPVLLALLASVGISLAFGLAGSLRALAVKPAPHLRNP
jgi:putative ABC transport system permease protein